MNEAHRRPEPLWHLLYRYIWPFQYFRDVSRGSQLERQQNYRYNRSIRHYLPAFALRWFIISAGLFGIGQSLHGSMAVPMAGCFVSASLASVVWIELVIAWYWLERFPERY
ncbi:hypothetical protein ACDA63_12410 [Uliginosibacterium sp. sgz301328]|uniref:hypothetical protein n=1 Tax=Uliginosibacterium sp. sgz301328 TaxID=3243764 RepID=UPI00359E148D